MRCAVGTWTPGAVQSLRAKRQSFLFTFYNILPPSSYSSKVRTGNYVPGPKGRPSWQGGTLSSALSNKVGVFPWMTLKDPEKAPLYILFCDYHQLPTGRGKATTPAASTRPSNQLHAATSRPRPHDVRITTCLQDRQACH